MAVPKLRFKDFDQDWTGLKIKDLVKSLDAGVSVNSEEVEPQEYEYSVLKTSCISSGYFDENERKRVLQDGEIQRLKEPVLDDSILMSRMNTPLLVGMNAYVFKAPKNTFLPDRLWQLKIDNNKTVTRWLAFYLGSDQGLNQIRDLASGTSNSMKNITKPDVLNIDLFAPQKEEQTKIASFLSNVDEKISQLNQKHELLSQYKQGMMQKLFSQQIRFKADDGSEFGEWEFIKLNQLGKSYNGLTGKTKDDFGNGDAYVTYKQIFDNRKINLQKIDKVNIQPHETQNRVIKGDLFFTTSSEIPEEVAYCSAILDDFDYPLYLNSFCFGFRPNNQNQLNSNYASFFFRSNQFRNTILHLAQGSTRFNISKTAFMDMKIALPRVEEQTKVANFLSVIDQKIEVVAQQIEQAKTWKKGLLQQMFV